MKPPFNLIVDNEPVLVCGNREPTGPDIAWMTQFVRDVRDADEALSKGVPKELVDQWKLGDSDLFKEQNP